MTELNRELLRAFNLIGRLEGHCELLERRIRALEGCGPVVDQTPTPAPRETHDNVVCLPGVTLEGATQSTHENEMEMMAGRAWRERGIAILWPDRIKDERDRQRVLNIARNVYGERGGQRP